MKLDIHVKNIRNMKFNGWIFNIHTWKKKKKCKKFEKFLFKLIWRKILFVECYLLCYYQLVHANKRSSYR